MLTAEESNVFLTYYVFTTIFKWLFTLSLSLSLEYTKACLQIENNFPLAISLESPKFNSRVRLIAFVAS